MAVTRGQSQRDDGPASGAKSEAPADASAQPNGRGMQEQHEQPGGPQPPPAGPKEEEPATWKVLVVVVCTLTSILAGIMGVIWLTKASDETACQSSPPYGETRGRGWFRGCKWEAASDPGYDPRSTWFSRKACGAASRVRQDLLRPQPGGPPLAHQLQVRSPTAERAAGGLGDREPHVVDACLHVGAQAITGLAPEGVPGGDAQGRLVPSVEA